MNDSNYYSSVVTGTSHWHFSKGNLYYVQIQLGTISSRQFILAIKYRHLALVRYDPSIVTSRKLSGL